MEFFDLKSEILKGNLSCPIVFEAFSLLKTWPFSSMTIEKLVDVLGGTKVKFRIGRREKANLDVQWEGECQFINATMKEFSNWINNSGDVGQFSDYDQHMCWAYADYIYMRDLFENIVDFKLLDQVSWSKLGFNEDEGEDTAIWIGTNGGHSVCHYDTYGYNLVYQVFGRKRWILFPPTDTPYIYPTRLPYEESSVFSKINFLHPDIRKHPKFALSHPHVVVLEPGDLLFVPKHWWHFVENLETSISVNAWFPIDADHDHRLQESITRLLIGCALSYGLESSKDQPMSAFSHWLNPTESMSSANENITYLQNAVFQSRDWIKEDEQLLPKSTCVHGDPTINLHTNHICKPNQFQCSCVSKTKVMKEGLNCYTLQSYCFYHAASYIEHWNHLLNPDASLHRCDAKRARLSTVEELDVENGLREDGVKLQVFRKFVDCLTHPSVVEVISSRFKQSILEDEQVLTKSGTSK